MEAAEQRASDAHCRASEEAGAASASGQAARDLEAEAAVLRLEADEARAAARHQAALAQGEAARADAAAARAERAEAEARVLARERDDLERRSLVAEREAREERTRREAAEASDGHARRLLAEARDDAAASSSAGRIGSAFSKGARRPEGSSAEPGAWGHRLQPSSSSSASVAAASVASRGRFSARPAGSGPARESDDGRAGEERRSPSWVLASDALAARTWPAANSQPPGAAPPLEPSGASPSSEASVLERLERSASARAGHEPDGARRSQPPSWHDALDDAASLASAPRRRG